jgi:hypothetical protein
MSSASLRLPSNKNKNLLNYLETFEFFSLISVTKSKENFTTLYSPIYETLTPQNISSPFYDEMLKCA